ncbi:hypothetical protein EYR40_003803 [Pleurotus pulmonarius]|nr:hypothetical protein EYR40_003803 [Pleurotus pulmonarius]
MDQLRSAIFYRHTPAIFTSASVVLAYLTFLSATPPLLPLVFLIATVQVYGRMILYRRFLILRAGMLWLGIATGISMGQIMPSLHALMTPGTSIGVLFGLSSASSLIALLIIFIDVRFGLQLNSPWSQMTIFPALWASIWSGVSYVSPFGRLAVWSPIVGVDQYRWLLPWVGPTGIDWLVGAWAAVLSQAFGAWLMGPDKHEDTPILVEVESHDNTPNKSTSRAAIYLVGLLGLLTVPSFLFDSTPLAIESSQTTPLSVGCVIPSYHRYKHRHLVLHDFIEESKKLASAHIILWPEGAVSFRDSEERDEAFKNISSLVSRAHVAVSFEEFYSEPSNPRVSHRRTGMALVAPNDPNPRFVYYKRHLVPIAESFSMTHSDAPPAMYTMLLPAPPGYNKTDWAPPPSYTRPIDVTASICLDFSAPSPFTSLGSRPGLILGPARTWHKTVGLAMWEQAKQRADEVGGTLLWCDGGEGGVSGVAGHGLTEVTQVGEGSWKRDIGIPYPLRRRRTLYATVGDFSILVFFYVVVGLGMVKSLRRLPSVSINLPRLSDLRRKIRAMIRARQGDSAEQQPLLVLRGLRNSTAFHPTTLFAKTRRDSAVADDDTDDFQRISRDDFASSINSALPASGSSSTVDHHRASPPPSPPHTVFSRLANVSRLSLHPLLPGKPRKRAKLPFLSRNPAQDEQDDPEFVADLVAEFPAPPTFIPTPVSSTFSTIPPPPASVPFETSSPTANFDPFDSEHRDSTGREFFSFHSSNPPETPISELAPSIASKSSSFRRFASLTATVIRTSFHTPISEISTSYSPSTKLRSRPASAPPASGPYIPFDHFVAPRALPIFEFTLAEEPEEPPAPSYELVSPLDLTASPSPFLTAESLGGISARTSFIPPSPSWLSRNVGNFGTSDFSPISPETHQSPPQSLSLPPLPIPPLITISSADSPPLSPLEISGVQPDQQLILSTPSTLVSSSISRQPSISSVSQASTKSRRSNRDLSEKENQCPKGVSRLPSIKRSGSFSTAHNIGLSSFINSDRNRSLVPYISLQTKFSRAAPSSSQAPASPNTRSLASSYIGPPPYLPEIFIPSVEPSTPPTFDHKLPSLPEGFKLVLDTLCKEAGFFTSPISNMDFAGKRNDVVDIGGDWDYSDRQWFQNPPSHPPPPPVAEPMPPYVPSPQVIELNKDFEIALDAAPNVLYGKYKQYGQLGVLGWCAEFSELIDALKELGFSGNMFVTTRQSALKACEDILKLKLDIRMQIIVMYLSSQVARLRRFLDGEKQWDDYPATEFPMDPRNG